MAVLTLSLSAGSGTLIGPVVLAPTNFWTLASTGISCLVNFSGQAAAGGTPAVGNVTLQISNDPNANPNLNNAVQAAAARWNNHDILVNLTGDKNDSIVYPCRYLRLVGTVTSGTVYCFVNYPDTSNQ